MTCPSSSPPPRSLPVDPCSIQTACSRPRGWRAPSVQPEMDEERGIHGGVVMAKATMDVEAILKHAAPVTHQQAHETQPFGHLVRMPIALSESVCKASVENLNQLLADTIALRDLYKKHHWQVSGPT